MYVGMYVSLKRNFCKSVFNFKDCNTVYGTLYDKATSCQTNSQGANSCTFDVVKKEICRSIFIVFLSH